MTSLLDAWRAVAAKPDATPTKHEPPSAWYGYYHQKLARREDQIKVLARALDRARGFVADSVKWPDDRAYLLFNELDALLAEVSREYPSE